MSCELLSFLLTSTINADAMPPEQARSRDFLVRWRRTAKGGLLSQRTAPQQEEMQMQLPGPRYLHTYGFSSIRAEQ